MPEIRETLKNYIDDAIANFFYYDRKECDVLPRGAIEEAVERGEITMDEIAEMFKQAVLKG